MSDALNKKNFLVFANQCKGASVTAIDVTRTNNGKELRLKYRGRDPRTGKVFNGEWVVPIATAGAGEKTFFELAEKEFAVTRHESGDSAKA